MIITQRLFQGINDFIQSSYHYCLRLVKKINNIAQNIFPFYDIFFKQRRNSLPNIQVIQEDAPITDLTRELLGDIIFDSHSSAPLYVCKAFYYVYENEVYTRILKYLESVSVENVKVIVCKRVSEFDAGNPKEIVKLISNDLIKEISKKKKGKEFLKKLKNQYLSPLDPSAIKEMVRWFFLENALKNVKSNLRNRPPIVFPLILPPINLPPINPPLSVDFFLRNCRCLPKIEKIKMPKLKLDFKDHDIPASMKPPRGSGAISLVTPPSFNLHIY